MGMPYYETDEITASRSLGYRLRRAHQLSVNGLEPILAAEGLNGAQWSTLMMLLEKRSTPAELARDIAYDQGGMTRLLDHLEKRGLVTRTRGREDRRMVHVDLTDEGRAVARRSRRRTVSQWNEWLAAWSKADVSRLLALLEKLDRTVAASPPAYDEAA